MQSTHAAPARRLTGVRAAWRARQPFPVLPGAMAEAFFAITDGLPFQSVGRVTQTFAGVGDANGAPPTAITASPLRPPSPSC
jgi:hypothetical protein